MLAVGRRMGDAQFELRLRAKVLQAGQKRSSFRGRGVDFQESRIYQPGDDIRHLDWRVTARSGKAHTKLFEEEKERPVFVVVNLNSSMFFGSRVRLKAAQAGLLGAAVAWGAQARKDRIGGVVYGGDEIHEVRPKSGRGAMLALLQTISDSYQAQLHQTNESIDQIKLSDALEILYRLARPGSLMVLISDLQELDAASDKWLGRLRAHNDLAVLRVSDPLEEVPPARSALPISDGFQRSVVRFGRQAHDEVVQAQLQKRHEEIQRFQRHGIPIVNIGVQEDPISALAPLLGKRRK